ncbi:hypothetical protein [Flavobacterium sp. K5-23]|uniref:hypothetical protein n=1 Tax=Flavobacterium sp. K5-23 TaxID=2746225 RepID=UPI00200EDCA1|nr:hypothetical protein [Flavobacterium sp. K5-23]UQD56520.1 hypothetical protein FLAK523_09025 [Flavobacterium sp. K5-23]
MSQKGNTMITMMFTAGPDAIAEGDRIFASHAKWMKKTHARNGELALMRYNVAKGPEHSNPLDPSSTTTGNTTFTLYEVYKNPEGLEDHWKQAQESWLDFNSMMEWAATVKLTVMHGSTIEHSLW